MVTTFDAATFSGVSDDQGGERPSGAEFQARRDRIGIKRSELAKRAGVDRSRVQMLEEDDPRLRGSTVGAISRALADLEREMGMDEPSRVAETQPNLVRIKIDNMYGISGFVLEGEPEDKEVLIEMVAEIVRQLREGDGDPA